MDNSISLSELDYDDVDHASLSEGNYDTTFSDEKEWSNPSELTSEDIPLAPSYEEDAYVEDYVPQGPDALSVYLQQKGISDPSRIQFQESNGVVVERDWNELDPVEQLNVLHEVGRESPEVELDDLETFLINQIRAKGITPQQFIKEYQDAAVAQEYLRAAMSRDDLDLDSYSDDDVFKIDLLSKMPDIDDVSLEQALAAAKSVPEVFQNLIDSIRNDFFAQRLQNALAEQQEHEQEKAYQYKVYEDGILNAIQNFNQVGGLDVRLQDDDMNNIASLILEQDDLGYNQLGRLLLDPENAVAAAWFLLSGNKIFDDIQQSVQRQVVNARQEGYNMALAQMQEAYTPKVVRLPARRSREYIPPKNAHQNVGEYRGHTLYDIDYDKA